MSIYMYVILVRDIHRDSVRARGCSRDLEYLHASLFSREPLWSETYFLLGLIRSYCERVGVEILHPPPRSLRHNRCCLPTIGLKNGMMCYILDVSKSL